MNTSSKGRGLLTDASSGGDALNADLPTTAEQRLNKLGIKLPAPPEPFGTYVEAVQTGNLLFLTGMLPTEGRSAKFVGRVGAELDVEAGRKAAYLAALNVLAVARRAFGIARQSDAGRPARRVGGHFGRCPRSAESRRRALPSCCKTSSEKTRTLAAWCMALQAFRSAFRSSWKSYSKWRDEVSAFINDSQSIGGFMATTRVEAGTMKVAQISKPGGDFEMVEREIPKPGVRARAHQGAGLWRLPQ